MDPSLRSGHFDGSLAVEDANTAALFDLAANPRAALGDNANFTAAMVALLKLAGTPAADKLPYLTGASAAAQVTGRLFRNRLVALQRLKPHGIWNRLSPDPFSPAIRRAHALPLPRASCPLSCT
jgi:hypothetical protein